MLSVKYSYKYHIWYLCVQWILQCIVQLIVNLFYILRKTPPFWGTKNYLLGKICHIKSCQITATKKTFKAAEMECRKAVSNLNFSTPITKSFVINVGWAKKYSGNCHKIIQLQYQFGVLFSKNHSKMWNFFPSNDRVQSMKKKQEGKKEKQMNGTFW